MLESLERRTLLAATLQLQLQDGTLAELTEAGEFTLSGMPDRQRLTIIKTNRNAIGKRLVENARTDSPFQGQYLLGVFSARRDSADVMSFTLGSDASAFDSAIAPYIGDARCLVVQSSGQFNIVVPCSLVREVKVVGTDGADFLVAKKLTQPVFFDSRGGNDRLVGTAQRDTLFGGDGFDYVQADKSDVIRDVEQLA